MSPRAYSMEKRHVATSETRMRILEAARQLLASDLEDELTLEAIARKADVSRLTIYYQFDSRRGLLEALYDYLASRGNMRRIPEVFHESNPFVALDKFVAIFVGFWASDPIAIRRLRAMAALDPEISQGIDARDARRRHIATEILKRMIASGKKTFSHERLTIVADVLSTLAGFATYDALAKAGHGRDDIIAMITQLCRRAID